MSLRRRTAIALLVAVSVAAAASQARADLDLTGDWNVEVDEYFTGLTSFSVHSLAQAGGDLSWSPDATGTVDAMTGVFLVQRPGVYPPGARWQGTVSPDGNSMAGTYTFWAWTAGIAQPYSSPMRGLRVGLSDCGDSVREIGEQCDHGEANGQDNCCTPACVLVDPDRDGACSDVDNCPDIPFGTACGEPPAFEIVKLRANAARQLSGEDGSSIQFTAVLRGLGAPGVSAVPELRVRESNGSESYEFLLEDLACLWKNESMLLCTALDGKTSVKIRTNSKGTTMKAKLRKTAMASSPRMPVTVTFRDNFGLERWAAVDDPAICRGCLP